MRHVIAVLVGSLMLSAPLQAQQDSTLLASGPAVGGTVGVLAVAGEGSTAAVALEVLELHPHAAGAEFSLVLLPQALSAGTVAAVTDLGVAYNVSMPGATFFLKAGASALVGWNNGYGDAYLGWHVGAAFVARTGRRIGLLLGLTDHVSWSGQQGYWTISIGLARLPLGAR